MVLVAAHGAVDEYCEAHEMGIAERYDGALEEYNGACAVVVTAQAMDKNEFFYLKYKFLEKGRELVSIHEVPCDKAFSAFLAYVRARELESRRTHGGRPPFGYRWRKGQIEEHPENMVVARRIFALRDAGATYKQIADDPDVHYADGRRMSVSTVQTILKNRSKYE